jgi:hypothetical protein
MRALSFALATLALACAQQEEATSPAATGTPAATNAPPPATYTPPIAPVYVAPANTAAAESGPPPLSGGPNTPPAASDAGTPPAETAAIPDKLTVTPPDAFKDGQKVDMFVRANARECFKEALKQDPKADGRIAVKVTIDAKGEVSSATASLDGTLPVSLGQCVEKKSKPAFFKAPSSAPVTVVVPMVLTLKKK